MRLRGYWKTGWRRLRAKDALYVSENGHFYGPAKGVFYFGPRPDMENVIAEGIGVANGTWKPLYLKAQWTNDNEVIEFVQHLREYCNVRKGKGVKLFMEDGVLVAKLKGGYIINPSPAQIIKRCFGM